MKHSKRVALLAAGGLLAVLAACSSDLNVTDPNNPDTKRAFSTVADVQSLAVNSFRHWFIANQYEDPNAGMAVMADALASAWGNFGMRFNSAEPRIPYANSTSSGDAEMAQTPWDRNYSALGEADDALNAAKNGLDIGDEYKALATLVQGLTLGNIALIFDQGYVIDDSTTIPASVPLVQYTDVENAALAKFDAVIAMSKDADWDLDAIPGLDLTGPKMAQLASTMAARLMAYAPRNATENAAVDWAKVATYAAAGITSETAKDTFSLTITGDGYNLWYDDIKGYGNDQGWMRVNMRIIHEMVPSEPAVFTDCNYVPPPQDTLPSASADKRFGTDFTYYSSIPFDPARGCWHFSYWTHERYVTASFFGTGPLPVVLGAENDLLLAGTLVRSGGDLNKAAELVNRTRVGRGGLAPVSADATSLLAAIQYEQDVELLNSGGGVQYYDQRRIDGLEPGTPHHLPVPASELQLDGLPTYTFGGAGHEEAPLPWQ